MLRPLCTLSVLRSDIVSAAYQIAAKANSHLLHVILTQGTRLSAQLSTDTHFLEVQINFLILAEILVCEASTHHTQMSPNPQMGDYLLLIQIKLGTCCINVLVWICVKDLLT